MHYFHEHPHKLLTQFLTYQVLINRQTTGIWTPKAASFSGMMTSVSQVFAAQRERHVSPANRPITRGILYQTGEGAVDLLFKIMKGLSVCSDHMNKCLLYTSMCTQHAEAEGHATSTKTKTLPSTCPQQHYIIPSGGHSRF